MLLISLLGLAFASVFTMLALGLAILTLLLVLLLVIIALLLVRPLLLISVRVTMLVLNHADFVGVVLARAIANRVCLELHDNYSAHVTKFKVIKVCVASNDRDEHLPFLRKSSKGNHHLELRGDGNIGSFHMGISTIDFVKVQCLKKPFKYFEHFDCVINI